MTITESTVRTAAVEHDPFIDGLDTPATAHDCEMDEIEATRFEHGIDIPDNRYL